jgi:ComF family protein
MPIQRSEACRTTDRFYTAWQRPASCPRLRCVPRFGYHAGMRRWIGRIGKKVGGLGVACCDLLYPPACIACGAELADRRGGAELCDGCLRALGPEATHSCRRCGGDVPENPLVPGRCLACQELTLCFDTVIPLGSYDAELRWAVLRMKRVSHNALAAAVGRLLAQRRHEHLADVRADFVVPVPMFWRRRLRRGINSPNVLARHLAASLRIPMRPRVLIRRVNTKPQTSLSSAERRKNVRGAFRVRRPDIVRGARILLVDDVLTTGATCSEAAKTLKEAGAAMVAVAVVARTPGPLSARGK